MAKYTFDTDSFLADADLVTPYEVELVESIVNYGKRHYRDPDKFIEFIIEILPGMYREQDVYYYMHFSR